MDAGSAPSPRRTASLALAYGALGLVVATIAGALTFQAAGIAPCELCLKERWPYYAGVALGAMMVGAARRRGAVPASCFAALALLFCGSAAFGAYHAGVEWGWWAGPSDCTGALSRAGSMGDFMHQLQTVHVVRCDAVAIRILGLSLAGWNALVSTAVAGLATAGTILSLRAPSLGAAGLGVPGLGVPGLGAPGLASRRRDERSLSPAAE